jgi:hypothetical protein
LNDWYYSGAFPGGNFLNGSGYLYNDTGIAPVVNCQETFLFLDASDNAKSNKASKKKSTKFGTVYNTITNNYAMVLDSPASLLDCIGTLSYDFDYPSCSIHATGCFVGKAVAYPYYDEWYGYGYCRLDRIDDQALSACVFECYEANYERANTNAFTSGYDIGKSKVEDIDYDETDPEEVSRRHLGSEFYIT